MGPNIHPVTVVERCLYGQGLAGDGIVAQVVSELQPQPLAPVGAKGVGYQPADPVERRAPVES